MTREKVNYGGGGVIPLVGVAFDVLSRSDSLQ